MRLGSGPSRAVVAEPHHINPLGVRKAPEILLNATTPRPKEGLTGLLSTHPTVEERLAALEEAGMTTPHPTLSPEGRRVAIEGRGIRSADANYSCP